MENSAIAVNKSDFEKYGCVKCGCLFVHIALIVGGVSPVKCGHCDQHFVIFADGVKESPIRFGDERYRPPLVEHPRKDLWPHEFVRPDIRPKGIDGEFWETRSLGYDLSGFVKSKQAGERIVQVIKEVIEGEPKSWLDYRENEPLWIQVKIQKEEFDLHTLAKLCKDGVITKDRLLSCRVVDK